MTMDMSEGILSQDNFYFNDNVKSLLDFYLCKQNNDDTHITEGGKIGFKFQPEAAQSEEAFFITNLRYKEMVSDLVFHLNTIQKIQMIIKEKCILGLILILSMVINIRRNI